MNVRYETWQRAVFAEGNELLVVTGFDGIIVSASEPSVVHDAVDVLRALSEAPGVHLAIVGAHSLASMSTHCRALTQSWLVADGGETLRAPLHVTAGRALPTRESRGLRAILDRLPPSAATLIGVNARIDVCAVAAVRARPRSLAFHVADDALAAPEFVDGVVHGRDAWIDVCRRLSRLLDTRRFAGSIAS